MSKSPLLAEFSLLQLFPLWFFTPDAHHLSLISPHGFSAQTGQCWMSPVFAAGLYTSCGQTCSSSDFRNGIFFYFYFFSNVDRSRGDKTSGVGGDVTAPPVCLCLLSGPAPSSRPPCYQNFRPAPDAEPRRRVLMTSLPVYINNIALV